jgi:hypothetical protein
MRPIVIGLVLLQTSAAAVAQTRPNTETLTCSQTQSLVASRGSVLLGTGPSIYDIYVSSGAGCSGNETAEPAYVRTRDNPQCVLRVCRFVRRSGS